MSLRADPPTSCRVVVMGLGRFGGGIGVTRWLAGRGCDVTVTDRLPADRLAPSIERIRDLVDDGRLRLHLGGHREDDFARADLVVANPAVRRPWEDPWLEAARAGGAEIVTEIEIVLRRLPTRRVVAVTGSAGKSTTTSMIQHLLQDADGPAHLGGNIGGSLLDDLDRIGPDDWVVLELSSAMLWWLTGSPDIPWPHVGVVTNFASNHLDWHGDLAGYRAAKTTLIERLDPERGLAVLGPGRELDAWAARSPARVLRCVGPDAPWSLRTPGAHNQRNADLAATVVAAVTGRDMTDARTALATFTGLPHRLQLVNERAGTRFYDDSKSTTPQATVQAVSAFPEAKRIHLIAGGYDKGADLGPIADLAAAIAGVYAIGATGPTLADQVRSRGGDAKPCETLERAVDAIRARLRPGDIVLLSPGCASWDQFENFEARGRKFAELVGG